MFSALGIIHFLMTTLQQRLWMFLVVPLFTGFGIVPQMVDSRKNSAPISPAARINGQLNPYRISMPTVYVLENATIGSVIIQDIRSHLGLSMNSMVKLGPGSLTQFFRLDSDSGRLVTISSLDLESPEICQAEKSCCRQELPNGAQQFPMAKLTYNDPSLPGNTPNTMTDAIRELSGRDVCRMMAFVLSESGAEKQLTPITRLYVTVVDLNDNAPVFRLTEENKQTSSEGKTTYNINKHVGDIPAVKLVFSEGSVGLHSRHDLPSAYDADFALANRVKRYWLEWDKDKSKFPIDSLDTGTLLETIPNILSVDDQNGLTWANLGPFRLIYLEPGRSIALELDSELDREQQDFYQLRLVAEDGGGLRGQIRIEVEVLDVNEFTPVFADEPPSKEQLIQMKPRTIYRKRYSVKESLTTGSELGQLRAYDADQSPGNWITYRLGPSNPPGDLTNTFQIHPKSGVLKLVGTLDYETTQQYRLTIIAQDGPTSDNVPLSARNSSPRNLAGTYRSATAIVEINVIDVNDNAPVIRFEKEDNLPPNTSGGSHPTVTVVSKTVSTDGSKIPYEVWIKEDLPKGSPVTFFSVSDRDLADNGRVTCSLMNWTERFRLHEFTGLYGLETMDGFDREHTDSYYLTIRCHDYGVPVLQTDRALLIHIEDVNDLPPVFQLPVYQFHVQENSPPGTPLKPINANFPKLVTATDPDLNSTIKYHLEPRRMGTKPNPLIRTESGTTRLESLDGSLDHTLFQIDSLTGLITTQGELDREERTRLNFQVCADDGKHVTCTDVTVLLDDVNDNRPQFDRDTYVIRVEENQLSHKPCLTFRVTDADAGNHGFVFDFLEEPTATLKPKHKLVGRNQTGISHEWEQFEPGSVRYHFALRENTLYVRRPLDREFRSNYHFFVTVTDSQEAPRIQSDESGYRNSYPKNFTSKAEIFIDVGDVNDNAPTFIFPNSTGPSGNRLSVSCHETMGSSVSRLQATDPDLGLNSTVTFSLIHTPEADQLFYLDAQSGELFVNTGQLADRCGESLIMIVSVDDQGPPESKQARSAPVERMLIKIEDKPTLAELIAAEARQQWRVLGETSSDGRHGKNQDSSSDGIFTYGVLSTRTILSVVLGGSTVFLIGLLVVWMILLLYNRSKRRKNLRPHEIRRYSNKPRNEPDSHQAVISANETSEKNVLFSQLNSAKLDNQYCEQFVRNVVQGDDKPETIAVHQSGVPMSRDYYRCVTDSELGYLTGKDGQYGKYAMRLTASPTIISRISTTPPNSGPDGADYSARLCHPDHDMYHTCIPEQFRHSDESGEAGGSELCSGGEGSGGIKAPQSLTMLRRSPGGLELATMSRDPKESSTFGRLLPRWIVNNIVPRQQANKDGYPMENDAYMLQEKRALKNSTAINNSVSLGYRTAIIQHEPPTRDDHTRSARNLNKPVASCSSPDRSDTYPHASTLAYTSLRRHTLKQKSDRVMNNQTDHRNIPRASYPFLTPPVSRREVTTWGASNTIGSPQTVVCLSRGEYTSLLRPSTHVCEPRDCPSRPSSSIPLLSLTGPTISESTTPECGNIPMVTTGRRLLSTPTGQILCQTSTSYPCCSACDPLLAGGTSALLDSYDLIGTGDHQTDSIQNCPQCQMMGTNILSTPCCPENCSLLHAPTKRRTVSTENTNSPHMDLISPIGSGEADSVSGPQCSTTYMSMQEMLNSCV